MAKRNPLVRPLRFALVKNMRDGAIRIRCVQTDLHVTRRTEKLAGTRRHDGDGGRLVVAEVADGHRLVTVHHDRDRFLRAGDVALPVIEAKAFARLGRQRHFRSRRVGRQAWLDLDCALSRGDHGGQLIVHVDLDRVAVLNAKRIAQRDRVPTGLPGGEIGQLQPTLCGAGNWLVVFRPLNAHRRADGVQLKQRRGASQMRSVAGDRTDDRLAVVIRCTVRLPCHRLVRHIDLHRLHGAEAGFAGTPDGAVIGMPSGLAIRLQQAKLGSGRSRCGKL